MRADPARLRPWTEEYGRAEPHAEPSVAVFRGGGKTLAFVATLHVHGRDAAVFPTIERAFADFRARALVVEGWPRGMKDLVGREDASEREYAVFLAERAGVPALGGEPSERESFAAALAGGFTAEDYLGFDVARFVSQWRREAPLDDARFDALAAVQLRGLARALGLDGRFGVPELRRWFAARRGASRPLLELENEDVGPVAGPGQTFLQSVSCAIDSVRETIVVRAIEDALNAHETVLVVYGSAHLVKQRLVWAHALGPAEDLKWF